VFSEHQEETCSRHKTNKWVLEKLQGVSVSQNGVMELR